MCVCVCVCVCVCNKYIYCLCVEKRRAGVIGYISYVFFLYVYNLTNFKIEIINDLFQNVISPVS